LKILILAPNEICYNPRLLKAADYFLDKGCEVTVFNPITGIAKPEVYQHAVLGKKWNLIEYDISKRNLFSLTNWIYASVVNKIISFLWKKFGSTIGFKYYLNKGLIGAGKKPAGDFDFMLINLVDNLPFASMLKQKNGAKLIYDSQEYFKGQYAKYSKPLRDWVVRAESLNIGSVDILIATTTVMLNQLISDYQLKGPSLRVRNLPSGRMLVKPPNTNQNKDTAEPVRLIWHGMTIYFNNTRGVHILLKAVALCKSNVHLVLQGLITEEQLKIFESYKSELKLQGKVSILPPADPYSIVHSLSKYDIGLIGELAQEDNQMLTSSNKLFDFLNAGLTVIASEMPGLNETINEYQVGFSYPPGNYSKMAEIIDTLAENKTLLHEMKKRALEISAKELFWEKDYNRLWDIMQTGLQK